MTSREVVWKTIRFENPKRLAHSLKKEYGTDFSVTGMIPSTDERPANGIDEWGVRWQNIGRSAVGEAKEHPIKEWSDFKNMKIPNVDDPVRWKDAEIAREKAEDKFLMGCGLSIYARVHYLRGLENAWMDIYENPDELKNLVDTLVSMNIKLINRLADCGVDGYFMGDDWGLQNRLMINPEKWREIWKPAYGQIFSVAKEKGIATILHSCGYIVDILDDLIEVGLDVIQMDQQENMGLDLLGERFGGRITFYSPVDIQNTMARGNVDEIRAYARKMVSTLGRPEGGFIATSYGDSVGAGHTPEAVKAMCEEFLKIDREMQESR